MFYNFFEFQGFALYQGFKLMFDKNKNNKKRIGHNMFKIQKFKNNNVL